jgi:hypothetical protein
MIVEPLAIHRSRRFLSSPVASPSPHYSCQLPSPSQACGPWQWRLGKHRRLARYPVFRSPDVRGGGTGDSGYSSRFISCQRVSHVNLGHSLDAEAFCVGVTEELAA